MGNGEHKSTARVLTILKVLASEDAGLTLTELSQHLNAPKSSLFPIIHTMANQNFIGYDENSQKYTIGLNAYLTGISYLKHSINLDNIKHQMEQIVSACSEICQFGVLDGPNVLYLAKVDSPEPVRLTSNVGKRLPAFCTSLGKALLCMHNMDDLKKLYPDPLIGMTQNTVTDLNVLYDQLKDIKVNFIAYERGETHPDISCISVPLFKGEKVVAAVSVSVPTFRFTPEKCEQIKGLLLSSKPVMEQLLLHSSF